MTRKQANYLRSLKTKENAAWKAMIEAAPCAFDSATAIPYLGENHALVVSWRVAAAKVTSFNWKR